MKMRPYLPPISDEDLREFETETGLTLPTLYREFLKKYNGGIISPNTFRYDDRGLETIRWINYFFGIGSDERFSLLRVWKVWSSRLPKRILPIANDGIGNLVCISVQGADEGKIYCMEHEVPPEEDEENLFLLAEDFAAFLDNLYIEED